MVLVFRPCFGHVGISWKYIRLSDNCIDLLQSFPVYRNIESINLSHYVDLINLSRYLDITQPQLECIALMTNQSQISRLNSESDTPHPFTHVNFLSTCKYLCDYKSRSV